MTERKNALEVLGRRGLIEWCSQPEELSSLFEREMVTGYVGFDPSADSLHVGNMVPIMGLAWLQRLGHRPMALVGGGTGLIGDPSGKTKERQLLSEEQVVHNMTCIRGQLERFLDFGSAPNGALLVNNYDWLKQQGYIEFLRDTGKYFTVNYMINREYIRSRLEDPEKSITYTELSYMLLQAFDFHHLYKAQGCLLQMGGNDQQGNLIAGIDLIRKKEGVQAYAATFPLLLTSSGQKFGKSEQGAVYLSPERTSPYRFYQFWINTEDADLPKLLRMYTFWDQEEIDALLSESAAAPERRIAQKRLAWDFTCRVHGEDVTRRVARASELLFGEFDLAALDASVLETLVDEIPTAPLVGDLPRPLVDLLVDGGACPSKGEAKRLLRGGGVSCNGRKVEREDGVVEASDLLFQRYMFLRLGKKRFHLLRRG